MTSGNRVRLRGVHFARAKCRVYVYAWRGGPRLLAPVGSPEFFAEYARAIEGAKARPSADTIAGLVLEFRASRAFRELAPATRADHERAFRAILPAFGAAPVAAFSDARIRRDLRKWRDRFAQDRQADKMLASFSRLLAFAVSEGALSVNPCAAIEARYSRAPDPTPVSAADLASVLEDPRTDADTARAIRVMAASGLARADAASLAWSHVRPDRIDKRRVKSKQRAQPPMTPKLKAALEACPRYPGMMMVLTRKGRPWRADALGKAIGKAFRAANVEASSHDLRASYACSLIARGATDSEAAEALGWSPETVAHIRRHYVDDAAIFEGRIARFADASGTGIVKPGVKPGKK